jgi:homoserine kinase
MASQRPQSAAFLEISLPATSANLGPAFDAAALAFNLYLKVSAKRSGEFSVSARGRDAEICGRAENHLLIETYKDVLRANGRETVPLALRINNEMPIGKGCGSSAAARLAGIALAVHFGKLAWNDGRIIGEASRREHHPDNAAACWLGGLVVARMSGEAEAQAIKIEPKGKWPLLFVIPEEPLSTEEARRVLPNQYSRADAVENIQNAMLLLGAFVQGKPELLTSALQDRIHQPYRAPLCPLLPAVQERAGKDGLFGVALSGAGPSVLAFLDPKRRAEKVKAELAAYLKQRDLRAELILTSIATKGAADSTGWRTAHSRHRPSP